MEPQFDDRFWATVSDRVERVREMTCEELARAEADLVTEEVSAEVVPVFPAPFWSRVSKRAAKVRQMALDELADAEESLLRQPDGARRHRLRAPSFPRLALPFKARFNTLGFVTAVLAVLLIMPQIVPISSFAGVRERGPLAFFFSGGSNPGPDQDERNTESSAGEADDEGTGSFDGSSSAASGKSAGSAAGSGEFAGAAPGTGMSGGSGGAGSGGGAGTTPGGALATGAGGTPGETAAGSSSSPTAGDGAAGTSTEDGAAALSVPDAPSNLLVTAVDDGSVRLRWKDNSSVESGFVIERQGQTEVGIQSVGANAKSYVWTGLLAGTEYCFRVKAENAAGTSSWVPEQYRCVTTHAAPATALPVALAPVPCAAEANLAAGADQQEAKITFRNLAAGPVRIYSLNRSGVRDSSPITLAPQDSTTVNTFLGRPFVVTAADEAASCLAIFSGQSWSSVATISSPSA